jgi:putative redox protein
MITESQQPAATVTVVQARWLGERRYAVGKPDGATAVIDGAGAVGPGPIDSVLGALAACSGIDVVEYLAKRRTPVEAFDVEVTAIRRGTAPRRVLSAGLEFRLDGRAIEAEHAERAVALAFGRYCSVAASLAPDIAFELTLRLNGGEPRPVTLAASDR